MKSLTNKLMVAAAAIAAVAGVASAQSMRAEVPFSFRVAGTVMPAGSYVVSGGYNQTGIPIFRLLNMGAHGSVLVKPLVQHDGGKQYTEAKLVFRCGTGKCALAQIWTGSGIGAFDLHTPKSSREEAALITIAATKGD